MILLINSVLMSQNQSEKGTHTFKRIRSKAEGLIDKVGYNA